MEERTSNGKKGEGNTKNGNQYLAWAFIEASNFAIRGYEVARWGAGATPSEAA